MNGFLNQQQFMELNAQYQQQQQLLVQQQQQQQQQLLVQQQQQQQQQQYQGSSGENHNNNVPVVSVPFNIPTRLNNTIATASLQRPSSKAIELLPIKYEPTNLDICSGRGKRNWNHSGNVAFRNFIQHSTPAYMAAATKNEKTTIVNNIVEDMRALGCKFLKEDSKTGRWYDIGDAMAREKVGHSLRDQVTAHNKSNAINGGTSTENNDNDDDHHVESSPHHQRRPSLALSDSGNEADARRIALDTTAVMGQFARRPSWIAGEFDASIPVTVEHHHHRQTSSSSDTAQTPLENETNKSPQLGGSQGTGSEPTSIGIPTIPTPWSTTTTTTIPLKAIESAPDEYTSSIKSADSAIESSQAPKNPFRRSTRESITMAEVVSWDPKSSGNTQVLESMLQGSVESWDPRMSSTTSMLSVRRSAFMAGNTTLRRLTNVLRASDISIDSLMDGIEFSDDESDIMETPGRGPDER